ncbi:MAG: esterase-like activity of phytase family protein [Bryobacterales bacterium]|nr:esterase-like activity of phytase family protein [Bryobacterales bacterium]
MDLHLKNNIRKLAVGLALSTCGLFAQTGTISATYTLPDIPIGPFQNSVLPGTIPDDHGFLLGGVGSGLYRSFLEGHNVYWMVTDRGPNPTVGSLRTWPMPGFTPWLIKVRTTGSTIEVLQKLPLLTPSGAPVTGIPNSSRDEVPRQCDGTTVIPFNPNGLDSEDVVRTLDGNFWLVEEHSPSIVKVAPNGKVSKRFLPVGVDLTGIGYPVANVLPQIYGDKRKRNRGFEGVTLGWDLRTIYAALQSPLSNPNATIGNASRNTRILAFDAYTEKTKAEYVYRFQPVTEFGHTDPAEMKISAVAALDPWRLLVLERTDAVAKIYRVDLTRATNILGSKWNDVATSPSLESLDDAALLANNLKVLPKELIIDLSTVPGMLPKIEGMAILDWNTIAIANDNDFDIAAAATCGTNAGTGAKSKILIIKTSKNLYF